CRLRHAHEIIKRSLSRMNQRRDTLRMLSVREAFKKPVGSAKSRKSHLGSIDQRREPLMVTFPGFAEEYSSYRATRTERLFNQPHAFNANEAIFRRQSTTKGHTKLLQPAIVAAGEECPFIRSASTASDFARRCHPRGE